MGTRPRAGAPDRVAVLGLGEAGATYARGLAAAGVAVVGWDPLPGAAPDGVQLASGPARAVRGAATVLSLSSGSAAEEAARAAAPGLGAGTLFADLNTASPSVKERVAAVVEACGAVFADVALLAPVPRAGVATPAIVSGNGAGEYARRLRAFGAPVEVVEGGPGAAAGRKLLRSVFMKGLAAVVGESLAAAAAMGCEPWLRGQIVGELERADGRLVDRLVDGSRRHAARRVEEMGAAMDLLAEAGVPARTTAAALEWLTELAGAPRAASSPRPPGPAERPVPGFVRGEDHMGEPSNPSDRARELVRGGYDLHVHVAPDVMERRVTDVDLARRCRDVGLAGFALKSHYLPTAERAAVVRAVVPEVDVVGGLTLNASVGGMNPVAVEVFARAGGLVVWFPTVDARNQRESRAKDPPDARPPMWARLQQELVDRGIAAPPVLVTDEGGEVRREVRDVLRLIAGHDLVLATGHLGRGEILAVVDAAVEEGVRRIVVTHPEFTSQRVPVDEQRALAAKGALLERCFTTPHTGKVSWGQVFDTVRALGPESSLWTTDLGQPFNPPVEDGLALMADVFLEAGFSEEEVRVMAVDNSVRVVKGAGT